MEERLFQGMEYIYEVYQAGSFRQAAENLYISQPSISASVKRVEERIGTPLFDRSAKPLKLTQCGEKYIAAVEQIQVLEREVQEYVNDWNGLQRGSLVLGGSSMFSSLLLPTLMSRFRRKYPHIHLELVEKTTSNLEYFLADGRLDMVMDYQIPHQDQYDKAVLSEDQLMLAVPKSLAVNSGLKPYRVDPKRIQAGEASIRAVPPVPLEKFREEAFILMKAGNDSRTRADILCSDAGFQPNVLLEFDQQLTNYHVTCSGMGVCFVGSTLVRLSGPDPNVVYYRLGGELANRQVCLFWRQGRYITKAMDEFRRLASGADTEL